MDKRKELKYNLYKEQEGKCFFCEGEFPIEQMEIEHFFLRSITNDDSRRNTVLCCRVCNTKKANQMPFREMELVSFLSDLLSKHPEFQDVNREVLLSKNLRYRGDIIAKRKINGNWIDILIEVKSFSTFTGKRLIDIINQMNAYKENADKELKLVFAFPGVLPESDITIFKDAKIEVWDRKYISNLFKDQIDKSQNKIMHKLFSTTFKSGPSYQSKLISDLKSIKKGRADWSKYQKHVQKILDYLFGKILSSPINESSDKYGINRRDFVLRNYSEDGFWKYLRDTYQADFIVIDAKNYTGKIKKNQILQISNYLKQHGTGLFAIIIARQNQEDTGSYFTRREKWITENKMIIILDDSDLEKMIIAKTSSNQPEEIIKQRIEDFRLEI